MTSWTLSQNTFILRRPRVAFFADIIKIVTMCIKMIFKDSKQVQRIRSYAVMYQNETYICICWYTKIRWISAKKYWCQQNPRGVPHDLHIFWIFFRYGIFVPSFIIVGYERQILGRALFRPFLPPHLWPAPQRPILNKVTKVIKRDNILVSIYVKYILF